MRSLTTAELTTVSGGGLFGNFGSALGQAIGQTVDLGYTAINGHAPAISTINAAAALGNGIGLITDSVFNPTNIPSAVSQMGAGIAGIIVAAKANKATA